MRSVKFSKFQGKTKTSLPPTTDLQSYCHVLEHITHQQLPHNNNYTSTIFTQQQLHVNNFHTTTTTRQQLLHNNNYTSTTFTQKHVNNFHTTTNLRVINVYQRVINVSITHHQRVNISTCYFQHTINVFLRVINILSTCQQLTHNNN